MKARQLSVVLGVPAMLLVLGWVAGMPALARPPVDYVPQVRLAPLDRAALVAEDAQRDQEGLAPRFAVPHECLIRPTSDGLWEELADDLRVWRLRVSCPDALSLNFGFTGYNMPEGGELLIYAVDGSAQIGPFTAADNEQHGELWTPVVLADDVMIEVTVPARAADWLILDLTSINAGYRVFGEKYDDGRSGSCNIDVICPEGDGWRDEISTVGVISTGGSMFCSGFMVNNTAQDETPYFMTANHCGVTSSNAASLVVYWNYQSPTCGQQGGGSLSQNQTGSYWRATYSASDFTLVELDDDPNPAWGVTFAGWDRSSNNPTSAVAIHHPSTDEKSISFEYQACTTTSYLGSSSPGDGTHIRVIDWDLGTTEGGSSGSPLFDQNHRVVGQLHGGYAACGNDESDWYGRFSVSWSHGLSAYLDPLGSGATTLDTLVPGASGMQVSPSDGLTSSGQAGGPFTPASKQYTLHNAGSTSFNYTVGKTQAWVTLSSTGGTLAAGATAYVTVSINTNANSLPNGTYSDSIAFVNTTTHEGDTIRLVSLEVGAPAVQYSFPMNTNPGWSTEDQWAFGQPAGQGGEYGNSDPSSGHTGNNVYGYNLAGDYANNLPERHLTSTAIDCSNLTSVTLKFWRWLNVERSQYDHAYVRVSNNGTTWTTVWENSATLTDNAWTQVEYDISAVADLQPTVYLRWTMGTTDSGWRYSGWNIDDVEIWGRAQSVLGACCYADGTCADTTQAGCTGSWQGAGTDCSPNPCPQPSGACCYANGTCTVTTQANCSGTWQGMGTGCSPNPCPQPSGACCYADGTCTVTTQANCSGTWQGMGTGCSPNPCPQPTGACCYADGTCAVTTQAACTGTWQGMGTDCDPNPCPQPGCPGDANCDNFVSWRDIDFFVAAMNDNVAAWSAMFAPGAPSCPFANNDVNGDGSVNWRDIDALVAIMNTPCP